MFKNLNYIFSKRDKWVLLGLLLGIVIGSFFELVGVAIFSPFIQIIMDTDIVLENEYLNYFYVMFGFSSAYHYLAMIAGVIIAIYVFKNIFLAILKNYVYKFSYGTQKKISTRLLKAYMNEDYTFHLGKNVAILQRSMQEDTIQFTQMLIHTMELVAELTVCLAIGIYLLDVSVSITVAVVGLLVICVGAFTIVSKKYVKKLGRDCQTSRGFLFQWVNQSLGGIKEIKILGREDFFIDTYETAYSKFARDSKVNRLMSAIPKYIVETVCMSGLLIAVILKMFYGQKDDIVEFVPQLGVFAVAAFRLLPSVGKINEHVNNIFYALPSIELIYEDLKQIEEYKQQTITKPLDDWKFTKQLEAKKVTYYYPERETAVIKEASFVVPKGKTVAFIGASGSGKTTMIDIMLGLLEPKMGKITADGLNIYKNLETWHENLGYIPQTIYLSDDTIRNNIAFGIKPSEIDDEKIMEALKKAQLDEFVELLPEGLETFVGDRGVRISGGQRQRIGIARALYHDPEILVLDEATSALDNETETAVMEAIDSLHGTKTIIIIAHRLTTIKNADIVYEVADGNVSEKILSK